MCNGYGGNVSVPKIAIPRPPRNCKDLADDASPNTIRDKIGVLIKERGEGFANRDTKKIVKGDDEMFCDEECIGWTVRWG